MKNALIILKINKNYINGGWEKWKRIVFYLAILLGCSGLWIQPLLPIFNHESNPPPLYFISIMTVCCFMMFPMYVYGCFVPQNIIDGNTRKTRDLRNHFVYMPFAFEDYLTAGLISWLRGYLISIIPIAYFVILTSLTEDNPLTLSCIGYAVLTNMIVYSIIGLCHLKINSRSKLIKKIINKLYTFSALIWILAGIIYGICYFFEFDLSAFAKLCSPLGIILTLLVIPIMFVLAKITLIKNKGRSWFNE